MLTFSKNLCAEPRVWRAGVVGCGRIGCGFDDKPLEARVNTHAGAYSHVAGVTLAALADVDPEKLIRYGTKFNAPGRYRDYRAMLEREELDIVSICTWNDTHLDITRAAVESGVRAIYCEKPIADSLASAREMIALCDTHDVLLAINHKRRFDRFHREAAEFIRGGGLGEIQQVTCYYVAGLANTGSHLLDMLRMFFGDVEWVSGLASLQTSPNPNDPNIDGWVQFRHGPRVALQACDVTNYVIFETNIVGTAGRLRIMASGFDARYELVRDSDKFPGARELFPAPCPVDVGHGREFMTQGVEHLLQCLETHQRPVSTGEDGLAALELICALRESAEQNGRRINLPLEESALTIQSR